MPWCYGLIKLSFWQLDISFVQKKAAVLRIWQVDNMSTCGKCNARKNRKTMDVQQKKNISQIRAVLQKKRTAGHWDGDPVSYRRLLRMLEGLNILESTPCGFQAYLIAIAMLQPCVQITRIQL